MGRSASEDPFLAFNFLVEMTGLAIGGFSEVTGLQVEVQVEDYREGGVNGFVHKMAGAVNYPSNLVLKRGLMGFDPWWAWSEGVNQGVILRQYISVVLLDTGGNEKRRWIFKNAYPVRWSGPELKADTNAVAFESLELVHQGMIRL